MGLREGRTVSTEAPILSARPGPPAAGGAASAAPIAPADRWGPFADGIDEAERLARLRSLRAIVRLCLGARGDALAEALRLSERDAARMPAALVALAALAPLDRRQVLASFASLHRPVRAA